MRYRLVWALGALATLAVIFRMAITNDTNSSGRTGAFSAEAMVPPDLSALGLDSEDWAEYQRAMQHEGTGRRIDRFLDKALDGQPFTVAVIGGSVSKGRGLVEASPPPGHSRQKRRGLFGGHGHTDDLDSIGGEGENHPLNPGPGALAGVAGGAVAAEAEHEDDVLSEFPSPTRTYGARTLYSPENMHVRIFDWLNATFPHPDNRFVNGAQGGVGAQYYAWCYEEHIPADVDLVLLELGINDFFSIEGTAVYEQLVRNLLQSKSQPAIINIETFTTLFPTLLSAASLHADVAAYYDFPSFSIRDNVLPLITRDPGTQLPKWFRTGSKLSIDDPKVQRWGGQLVDLLHISAAGHALASNLVITYLQRQLERHSWQSRSRDRHSRHRSDSQIPPSMLSNKFDPLARVSTRERICRTMNSAHTHAAHEVSNHASTAGGIRGIRLDEGSKGWSQMNWKEKRYLSTSKLGSVLHYTFITPPPPPSAKGAGSQGSIALGYQRSASLGFGKLSCWLDDNKSVRTILDGRWDIPDRNMGVMEEVATDLSAGQHTLHCELLPQTQDPHGMHEFRIFAIAHD